MFENKLPISNVGKWDAKFRNHHVATPVMYADKTTYLMAAAYFADIDHVEDWGCGGGAFRTFCISERYVGVDGSKTPFADKLVDLSTYRSTAAGIMMRHILEHNYEWEKVLDAALQSFQKKFCLVLFTPFAEETKEIAHNGKNGIDVPDLSFRREDIERHFEHVNWKLIQNIRTESQYQVEHVYFIWRT